MYKEIVDHILKTWPECIAHHTEDEGVRLGLARPYLVQTVGRHFQNMFYWDTYFTNLGLLTLDGELKEMAINHVENLCSMLNEFGRVPNSSLRVEESVSHSQPPYLSMMVRDVYKAYGDKEWLAQRMVDLKKEYKRWIDERSTESGLQQYLYGESDKFASQYINYLTQNRGFRFGDPSYEERLAIGRNFLGETESGWDFNPRFENRCGDFIPVDLNSNLYVYEKNFEFFSSVLESGEEAQWGDKAEKRKELMTRYLWDDENGMFMDYDFVNKKFSRIYSLASFSPLWAQLATDNQAKQTTEKLGYFETDFGLTACRKGEHTRVYQWDYPNGWAPLHNIVAQGLLNYGYEQDAKRIMKKYLDLVKRNFDVTGQLWEKYNAVEGNIRPGDEHPFYMPTLLGWTAGVFLWCLKKL